jgi:Na+/phosphate symporter
MWFESAYTFLGGLGIFVYGMKTLSESLQALSGDLIRRTIQALTKNRIMAAAVGAFVKMIVQSSSVTTVMIIGLVNANLMQPTQANGVIFGTNICTTITAILASIGANTSAKRAARAHALFNVAAVVLMTPAPAIREVPHLKYLPSATPIARPPRRSTTTRRGPTRSREGEITLFLRRVQRARLTEAESTLADSLIRAADELESVTDYCASVVRAKDHLLASGQRFTQEAAGDLVDFTDAVLAYSAEVEKAF